MKVGIITFHCAHNYGAMLQCVAMQNILEYNGCEVEVINYVPDYLAGDAKWFISPVISSKRSYNFFAGHLSIYRLIRAAFGFAKAILADITFYHRYSKCKKFEDFKTKYMNLSPVIYNTYDSLNALTDLFDLIICGSDQIWNPRISHGALDPAYFGTFAGKNTRVTSYAASACQLDESHEVCRFKELTCKMSCISVRENSYVQELSNFIDKKIRIDIDPTLLLSAKDYIKFEEGTAPSFQYVLLYTLNDVESKKTAKRAAEILCSNDSDLKIIDISYSRTVVKAWYEYRNSVSPGEFLMLFKNAKYIVTNSFHGTSFSIIYKKNFYSAVHTSRGNRIIDLLSTLGLSKNILNYTESIETQIINNYVNYAEVDKILQQLRESSLKYILDQSKSIN